MWKWGLLVISTLVLPKEEGPRMFHLSDLRLPAPLTKYMKEEGGGEKEPEFSGKGIILFPLGRFQD